uniref:Cytochrome c oxidase subunit 3 n=1 Tax=Epanerchodus koreanus TaxID=2678661 RepID=A0A7L8HYY0_9MYRI|nr:cytochrome c oxidase subunit III [Epanerchodus koreanus]QOE55891.1 cytochrome c oxidase subunit III [Epanerchodus koreanus]
MTMVTHMYHLVDKSPWPLFAGVGAWMMTFGFVSMFFGFGYGLLSFGLVFMILVVFQWWRDIVREGMYLGIHVNFVVVGLKFGMILFIVSEVFFFISFFWAFFHSSLSPTFEVGSQWPPCGIEVFNPFQIPLLNTSLLLSSGVSVTWAHHSLMEGDWSGGLFGLLMTVSLGLYFTLLQGYEYYEAFFSMSDSVYGSIFFMATGFHGFHVIIGSIFLLVCLIRHFFGHFSLIHHFGFEAAAWYWHFVDVVWLFLYIMVYWWGG